MHESYEQSPTKPSGTLKLPELFEGRVKSRNTSNMSKHGDGYVLQHGHSSVGNQSILVLDDEEMSKQYAGLDEAQITQISSQEVKFVDASRVSKKASAIHHLLTVGRLDESMSSKTGKKKSIRLGGRQS